MIDIRDPRPPGQPAFGAYLRVPAGIRHAAGFYVLTLAGDRICAMTGVMLPLALAPNLQRSIAAFNPLAHAVNTARALMAGRLTDAAVLPTFALFAGLALLALLWAARAMRSATA